MNRIHHGVIIPVADPLGFVFLCYRKIGENNGCIYMVESVKDGKIEKFMKCDSHYYLHISIDENLPEISIGSEPYTAFCATDIYGNCRVVIGRKGYDIAFKIFRMAEKYRFEPEFYMRLERNMYGFIIDAIDYDIIKDFIYNTYRNLEEIKYEKDQQWWGSNILELYKKNEVFPGLEMYSIFEKKNPMRWIRLHI